MIRYAVFFQFCSFPFADLYLRAKKQWDEDNYVAAEKNFRQLLFLYEAANINQQIKHVVSVDSKIEVEMIITILVSRDFQRKVNDAVKFMEQCLSIVRGITHQHEKFLSTGKYFTDQQFLGIN